MSVTEAQRGIRVEYSNRIERLVESLGDALERDGGLDRLFEPPRVVVPNRNVEKFLKFELADRFGIVGGIEFSTLEAWLCDELPEDVVPLEVDRLASAFVGLLASESFLEQEALEPVRSYLRAGGGAEGRSLRLYQLAQRLASHMREYGHSRTEMLDQWTEGGMDADRLYTSAPRKPGNDPASPQYRDNERWQRKMWRELMGDGGALEEAGDGERRYRLFTEYWREFEPERRDDLGRTVYLFGLSHVAPVYGQIFERMARAVQLRFFVLNPCREFWEDVVYEREEELVEAAARDEPGRDVHLPLRERGEALPEEVEIERRSFDPEGPSDAPLALHLWGRAGRDHVHMLNRLTGYAAEEHWVDPAADPRDGEEPSLLEVFQSDVLHFRPAGSSGHAPGSDESIRFIEAPGVRRELEAVADRIWRLVRTHDDVDFNDIAVVVNPRKRESYQMHLEAVFEEARGIPFNQVDVERGDGSRMLQAIELLLELPLGDFDRRELGSLLVHPNVTANYDEADPDEWARWCDELAIYHGADADDLADTYVDRDLYNWDQGVKRLVLGAFLEERSHRSARSEPIELGGETYLPEAPSEMAEPAAAGRWVALVRQLIGEARATRQHEDSLGGWLRWLANWIEEHLAPADAGEEAELAGYLDELRSAAEVDLSEVTGEGPIPYRTAVEFARGRLASQTYERGHYLATGVVVSSFVPQRPIPFEAIFMTGLSSEDFPGSSPRTPIDLRTAEWEEGDLWERDRERYMFFETLLSARRCVTCSWVARNPVTGDDLEPSAVVRELQYILEQYVGEEGLDQLVRRHPLRRFDAAYFGEPESADGDSLAPTYHPSAREERRAHMLRDWIVAECGVPETADFDLQELFAERDAPGELRETFELVDVPEPVDEEERSDDERSVRELRFRALRAFLVSPLQGWARYRLGLRDDDEEAILEETDEPFELAAADEAMVLRAAFERAATDADRRGGVDDALRDELDRATLEGRAPAGPFGRVTTGRLEGIAEAWGAQLQREQPGQLRRYRFGAPEGEEDFVAYRAVRLELEHDERRQVLDLTGDTSLVDPECARVYVATRRKSRNVGWRRAMRGWIQGLVLSAGGVLEGESFETVLLHGERNKEPVRVRYEEASPEEATEQLTTLARELWFEPHAYRFALSELEEVLESDLQIEVEALREEVWDTDESDHGSSSDEWGPVQNVQRLGLPSGDPEQLRRIVTRRMGPFVRGVQRADL